MTIMSETTTSKQPQGSLAEVLLPGSLQQIQDQFASALEVPIWIVGDDGQALTEPSFACGNQARAADCPSDPTGQIGVPITFDGRSLGRIVAEDSTRRDSPQRRRCESLLRVMADVLAERWNRQRHLHLRVGELTGMFRLAGEVAAGRDTQRVMDLVAQTIVRTLEAEGCCVRALSEDRRELTTVSAAGLAEDSGACARMPVADSLIDEEVLRTRQPTYAVREAGGLRPLDPGRDAPEDAAEVLCIPLSYKGWCEGVVHVYLGRQAKLDWYELNLLQAVMAQAAGAVVGTRLHREAMQAAELRRQMQTAGEVQRRMIPQNPPAAAGFEVATVYEPTYELSGDFYDFLDLPGGRLGVVICDVVGKGARASLLMASIRASLRAHAAEVRQVARVVERVNRDFASETLSGDFATLFYAVLDCPRRRLTYANAGHCPPLLVRGGKARRLAGGGMVLGVDPDRPIPARSLTLRPGDVLFAYTDGLTEATDFAGEQFGLDRLERCLPALVGEGASSNVIARQVLWQKRYFAGLQRQCDDLTIVAIRAL